MPDQQHDSGEWQRDRDRFEMEIKSLRERMHRVVDELQKCVTAIDRLRAEIVPAEEIRAIATSLKLLEERLKPTQTIVNGALALILSGVVLALLALVVKR